MRVVACAPKGHCYKCLARQDMYNVFQEARPASFSSAHYSREGVCSVWEASAGLAPDYNVIGKIDLLEVSEVMKQICGSATPPSSMSAIHSILVHIMLIITYIPKFVFQDYCLDTWSKKSVMRSGGLNIRFLLNFLVIFPATYVRNSLDTSPLQSSERPSALMTVFRSDLQ